jgi:hypothetical protein
MCIPQSLYRIAVCGVGGTCKAAAGPTSLVSVTAYERFRKSGTSQVGPFNFAEPPTLNAALVVFASLASRTSRQALSRLTIFLCGKRSGIPGIFTQCLCFIGILNFYLLIRCMQPLCRRLRMPRLTMIGNIRAYNRSKRFSTHRFCDPLQVGRAPIFNGNLDTLWEFI